MKVWLRVALAVAGLLFFVLYAGRVDARQLEAVFRELGGWLPLLLLPFLLVYLVDTAAWGRVLTPARSVSYWRLFRIRWAGEAVSNVIPSAYVGGEVVKIYLLRKGGIPTADATASTVVSKTAQSLAQIAFIGAASVVLLNRSPDQPGLSVAVGVILCGGVFLLVAALWLQRRGLFHALVRFLSWCRAPKRWVGRLGAAAAGVDRVTREFYLGHPRRFLASGGLYLCGWLLDTVEIFAFAWLSGAPISWGQALVVEAFTGVAKALGWFVPGSAGIQETGIVVIGRMAGLGDPLCVGYALFRRARELVYALAGWLLLACEDGALAMVRGVRRSRVKREVAAELSEY
jgi:uncharacterized membrane protein YbhN (UPF0104 family)